MNCCNVLLKEDIGVRLCVPYRCQFMVSEKKMCPVILCIPCTDLNMMWWLLWVNMGFSADGYLLLFLRIHISTDMQQSFHTKQNKCGVCFFITRSMKIPILKTNLFHDMRLRFCCCASFTQFIATSRQVIHTLWLAAGLNVRILSCLIIKLAPPHTQKYLWKVLLYLQNSVFYKYT